MSESQIKNSQISRTTYCVVLLLFFNIRHLSVSERESHFTLHSMANVLE